MNTTRTATRRHRGGGAAAFGLGPAFTLVELIAVLVVGSLIAVIAVPRMATVSPMRRGFAAQQIVRDLSYARERAIATGTRTWVVFSVGTNSYSVLAENPASPGRAGANVLIDPGFAGRNYVQYLNSGEFAGVTIASAAFDAGAEVGFDWLGRPYNATSSLLAAAGVVTLTGGTTVTVQVETGVATSP